MHLKVAYRNDTKNYRVEIVRSVRGADGKSTKVVIKRLGSAPLGDRLEGLKMLGRYQIAKLKEKEQPSFFPIDTYADKIAQARSAPQSDRPIPSEDIRALEEVSRIRIGLHELVGSLYDQIGLARVFPKSYHASAKWFRQEVLMRLAHPGTSKRYHAKKLSKQEGHQISEVKLYRMMDMLTDSRIKQVQSVITSEVLALLDGAIDILFFDATTFSFSTKEDDKDGAIEEREEGATGKAQEKQVAKQVEDASEAKGLRKRGMSKEGRHNQTQVVMGLIQTAHGLPVGYHLFPGNTADVSTLQPAIESLRERYKTLNRIVFVADAGMLSKENLSYLKSMGCDYVVAARLRSLNRKHQELITGSHDWKLLSDGRKLREHRITGLRLILRYCPAYAARASKKRQEQVDKAKEKLAKKSFQASGKGGRFIKLAKNEATLNYEAIAKEAQFDGLHGIFTSLKGETPQEIYRRYGELWRIENSFRVMKSQLESRPTFHWKPRRIKAHFCLCFVAFSLLRILHFRYHLKYGHKPISETQLLEEVLHVEASVIIDKNNNNQMVMPGLSNRTQANIYKVLDLKLQTKTVPLDESKITYPT